MNQTIDCFFIGYNEMEFSSYEEEIRKMGVHSGAYRDLNLSFITYNDKPYCAPEIFNLFYYKENRSNTAPSLKPLSMCETFSYTIAYLGTYLHRRGLTFDYVNSFRDDKEELARKLSKENIRTIAITTTFYISAFPILEIIDFIRKYNQTAKIILGGPFIITQFRAMDANSLESLFNYMDADFYVISTEGEATLVKLINALKSNLPLHEVNNIYYKTDGGYAATPIVREENDLNENWVDWSLFSDRVEEYALIRTSISCPFSCSFCAYPGQAGKYRTASLESLEKELNGLEKIKSLKHMGFVDGTSNVPLDRFKKILKLMIKNNYHFKWNSTLRCQFMDDETARLMKDSGCDGVFLGIESGSDKILKIMNKAVTVAEYYRGIELLKKYDIPTFGCIIIGFPGETDETVQETIKFIKEGGLDFFRTQLWYAETFTPIWERKDEFKITGSNFEWAHATMDSTRVCDIIDDIFLTIDEPLWVPQHNFDFNGQFQHLLYRGFTLEESKNFIRHFNRGVREKLRNPSRTEISFKGILELKKVCQRNEYFDEESVAMLFE